jgi:Cdc6-like AAA superfamily ATPase
MKNQNENSFPKYNKMKRQNDAIVEVTKRQKTNENIYQHAKTLIKKTPNLIAREKEISIITEFLNKSLKDRNGSLYISGTPGTGKTVKSYLTRR